MDGGMWGGSMCIAVRKDKNMDFQLHFIQNPSSASVAFHFSARSLSPDSISKLARWSGWPWIGRCLGITKNLRGKCSSSLERYVFMNPCSGLVVCSWKQMALSVGTSTSQMEISTLTVPTISCLCQYFFCEIRVPYAVPFPALEVACVQARHDSGCLLPPANATLITQARIS